MTRTIDSAAFDRYAVVAFGSPEVCAAVEEIRHALPPSGRPIMAAHVTVKGTFVNPINLGQTVETLKACCANAEPFVLTVEEPGQRSDERYVGAWLEPEPCAELVRLHWLLVAALADHGETVYAAEIAGIYRPHLTLVEEVPAEQADVICPTVERFPHRFTWRVTELALAGRRGGTTWETLATFPLGVEPGK